jgi:16S rRNA (cytosine1402-N4)-methyltransferase
VPCGLIPASLPILRHLPESSPAPGSGAVHVPVLLREVVARLELQPQLVVVDGTVGAGGHSREILSRIRPGGRLIGLDRDPLMLAHASRAVSGPDVSLIHSSYRDLRQVLDSMQIATVDRVLLDLGLSSDQLADRARGFGFDAGGALDMRFDTTQGLSAAEWLNTAPQSELTAALRDYGEVPGAERLAEQIVRRRPVETAADLIDIIESGSASKPRRRDKSSAAQVFQAVRIAVNHELEHLQRFLSDVLPACLAPGGRAAIITFHSLEDRLVKQAFRGEVWDSVTKKPIEATPAEARINPRSRSARLRVAVRRADDATRN